MEADTGYLDWPLLADLFSASYPGIQTKQDGLVIDIDRSRLQKRIKDYFDPSISNSDLVAIYPGSLDGSDACDATSTRAFLVRRGFLPDYIVKILCKPFDVRWIYWEPETALLGRKSPDLFRNLFKGNVFLEARRRESITIWSRGTCSSLLCDNFGNGFSNFFPLYLRANPATEVFPNASAPALAFLRGLSADYEDLFYHVVAVMHAPNYASENAGALRLDWPRLPLPATRDALLSSAALGRQVAALLDTETPVDGVTAGKPRPELKPVGVVTRVGGGSLNTATELDVTARWGVAGKGGVCMPGKGKAMERAYTAEERAALRDGAASGLDESTALACWGETTLDIYLNDAAYWRNVPARVWSYTLGGYQVVKKWLSYREKALLGRGLTLAEVTEVTHMVRRIAALLLLHSALDDNHRAVKADLYPWPQAAAPSAPWRSATIAARWPGLLALAPALYTPYLCDSTIDLALRGEQDERWSQGARPMQKLDVWHVVWVVVLVVGVLLLGLTLVIALYHRENSTFANFASIWGLFVGLIGFIVTIYMLFETQRVSRKRSGRSRRRLLRPSRQYRGPQARRRRR